MLVVVNGVELVKAVPAKLVLAFGALHKLTPFRADNIDFTTWTNFTEAKLIQVAKQITLTPIPTLDLF